MSGASDNARAAGSPTDLLGRVEGMERVQREEIAALRARVAELEERAELVDALLDLALVGLDDSGIDEPPPMRAARAVIWAARNVHNDEDE